MAAVTARELVEETRLLRRLPDPGQRRAIREAAGHTQQAVGDALGVSRVTVHRWESGTRTPRGRTLRAYALLLDELRQEVYG